MTDTLAIARAAFEEIAAAFPNLDSRIHQDEPVELSMSIPKQAGLDFDIELNLQNNDESHFSVSAFWCEWFPCTSPQKVEDYKESVIGFIAGDCRVVEHLRGGRPFRAELQAPENGSWATVAAWSTLTWPFPRQKTYRIVRNGESGRRDQRGSPD